MKENSNLVLLLRGNCGKDSVQQRWKPKGDLRFAFASLLQYLGSNL